MRFSLNGPDVPIRWYFVDQDRAKFPPWHHRFGSQNWDWLRSSPPFSVLGETEYQPAKRHWVNGAPPVGAPVVPGRYGPCGSVDYWQGHAPDGYAPVGPDCCDHGKASVGFRLGIGVVVHYTPVAPPCVFCPMTPYVVSLLVDGAAALVCSDPEAICGTFALTPSGSCTWLGPPINDICHLGPGTHSEWGAIRGPGSWQVSLSFDPLGPSQGVPTYRGFSDDCISTCICWLVPPYQFPPFYQYPNYVVLFPEPGKKYALSSIGFGFDVQLDYSTARVALGVGFGFEVSAAAPIHLVSPGVRLGFAVHRVTTPVVFGVQFGFVGIGGSGPFPQPKPGVAFSFNVSWMHTITVLAALGVQFGFDVSPV